MQISKVIKANYHLLILNLIGAFLASIFITLLFWTFFSSGFHTQDATDYISYYDPVSRNLLNGVGFIRPDGTPAINNPPGYPIVLAGVFSFARILRLPENLVFSAFVLICMGLSSLFVFLLAQKIWGIRGGWVSALFFMTYPFILWLTKQPNSEIPFMVAFYASLYLFWCGLKGQKYVGFLLFLAGIFAGGAMLIRGIAIGVGFLLFGLFLILKKDVLIKARIILALAVLLGNFLVVLPWQIWVYEKTGQMVLLGTNSVSSIRDGLTFAVISKSYRQGISLPADVNKLQNEFVTENASMNSLGAVFRTLKQHLMEEPLTVLKLYLIKIARSWYGTDSGSMESTSLIIQLFYGVIVLLATLIVWRAKNVRAEGLVFLVWGLVFYFWMMTTIALSILRYMTPVFGLFALLIPEFVNIVPSRLMLYLYDD
jgi:4-amino-4-deoxy-L-arabinose transferase-like glycosyltransferase